MMKSARIQAPDEDFAVVIRHMERLAGLEGRAVAGTAASAMRR
jgi:hypothetical protein